MVAFEMINPILWIAIPTAGEVVGRLDESILIYQVSDKYDANQIWVSPVDGTTTLP